MLIFDQLKKDDPQLRMLALVVLGSLGVLLAGLWWVQVVSARDYQANLETQSFRTVRIPAVRGKILDRNGLVLAENRPAYNVSLYLEELRSQFQVEYARIRPVRTVTNSAAFWRRWLGSPSVTTQYVKLKKAQIETLKCQARYCVASSVVMQVSQRLRQPLWLNPTNFERHYETRLALPCPVLTNLTPGQIALFEEQSTSPIGVDLEIQSARFYPFETTAAHVLGHLRRDDESMEGEEAFFSFRLPDYRGLVGVEYGFDKELRGMAGAKSVLVNNAGYRQTENVWSPAEPGQTVVLTLDLRIQQAAEQALPVFGPSTRGAVVVMDVRNGDLLALASSPTFNPNSFIPSLSRAEAQRISELQAEKNRATQENYAPGSIFKPIIGLACLEAGLNPNATLYNPGYIYVGKKRFGDLAAPGIYDFRRALKASCNTYFISNGLHVAGISNIVKLSQRFHLGERTGLPTRQEVPGIFPTLQHVGSGWFDGDTGNLCIGQGQMAVTPIQMAVVTAAIANGGKVLRPRLVDRLEPLDVTLGGQTNYFPSVQVRDELGVKPRNLEILREAMLADVQDSDGTGVKAAVPGMNICGKTGTAEVKDAQGAMVEHVTWFISFAPYENPRYAVVAMVEGGSFGGPTCAPIVRKVYTAIQDRDRPGTGRIQTLAKAN
jgi:penicillin-binding protein 2